MEAAEWFTAPALQSVDKPLKLKFSVDELKNLQNISLQKPE